MRRQDVSNSRRLEEISQKGPYWPKTPRQDVILTRQDAKGQTTEVKEMRSD